MNNNFVIGSEEVPLRSRRFIELPLPPLYTHTPMTLPVHVIRGSKDGPRLFVSAAIHGDELNGTEIIRRLLKQTALKRLRGTLVAVPIVNVYGVIHHSRYLPDRRDLNRSFPGSDKGSLAARVAHLFMAEIVSKCSHGVDLHTGAIHRSNLPQIRANLDDPEANRLAKAFGVPVLINSNIRDGSLRGAATEQGIPMLLYEAGEALRFDEVSIRAGVKGIIHVMRSLEMLPPSRARQRKQREPFIARSSAWVRAPASGLFRKVCGLGTRVKRGDILGLIDDVLGGEESEVVAAFGGIVIGCAEIPLIHEGEALFHIARFEDSKEVAGQVESFQDEHAPDDLDLDQEQEEPPIV
ncbi:MAG: succinylglutamate desuccinylase/aspartoacylase family protein [Gammaproteobacteria bacterium]|nr:succinylglutamate desuccinylase/aspartoacylase family protein [Gammaproteobacteria bacterium]